MLNVTVTRIKCNLFNGSKKEVRIVSLQHKSSRAANDIVKLLSDGNSLEGGDVITYQRNNKVVKKYTICNICCKNAAANKSDRCKNCTSTIDKVIGGGLLKQLSRDSDKRIKNISRPSSQEALDEHYLSALPLLQNTFM